MIRKILVILSLLSFAACASTPVGRNGAVKPRAIVTPYEYYAKARPAVYRENDRPVIQRAEASHNTGEDTKEDHTQIIIIGTLVGVAAIGGTVSAILLTR